MGEPHPAAPWRRQYTSVYRFVRRRSASREEAEDVTQEVFEAAVVALGEARLDADVPLAWLYTVARRRLVDRLRRAGEPAAPVDAAELADPDERAYGPAIVDALLAGLRELDEPQRRVIVLKLFEGRSFAEIAGEVGATEEACRMRFSRGLAALRTRLDERSNTVKTAYDVWTDPDLAALVRSDPELAAVADALAQAPAVAPSRRRLVSPSRVGMGAVAVAAAVALALVAPWERSVGSTSSLALAALGKEPVLHAVVTTEVDPRGGVLLELATGRTRRHTSAVEYWYDAQRRSLAIHVVRDGVVVRATLNTPAGGLTSEGFRSKPGGYRVAPDPGLTGFLTRYRDALADGRARVTGRTTLDGRRVVLLTIQRHPDGVADEVAVDAESYRPLRFRTLDRNYPDHVPEWRTITTIETVPRRPGQFAPPEIVRTPSGGRSRDVGAIPVGEAAKVLGRPALWPGPTVGGLELAEVMRQELRTSYQRRHARPPLVGRGLEVVYGTVAYDGSSPFVTIQESTRPQPAYRFPSSSAGPLTFTGFPLPPPGWVETITPARSGRDGLHVSWAQLRRDGLYLNVTASSRKLLLQALRQLRPLR